MSSTPSRPEPTDRATQRDEDAQYYRQVLHELIEIGTDLARTLHRQATPETKAEPNNQPSTAPDPTIAFDRIARTLRRTIALARKLSDPTPPRPAQLRAEYTSERRLAARKQIIRAVEDTIQRRSNGAEAEALHSEFYERLDDPDLDDDLDQRPVAEIIKDICRDFGIEHFPGTHPWKRRTPQDVRDLCARAARPSIAQPRPAQPRTAQPGTAPPHPFSAPPPRPPDQHRPAAPLIRVPGHNLRLGAAVKTQGPWHQRSRLKPRLAPRARRE